MSIVIDELVEYLKTAPTRLAVFGEFSAGKTTVLNALIGEEILSVAVEPTTAVPTRVCYGREFNIFIERVDDEPLVLFEDDPPFWTRFVGRRDTLSTLQKQQGTIRDFLRTWTKEGERADEVERVVIELPMDWLKGGLELVDTPGVNNEFARHHGFTEQEAGAADIALLLMDARQGGGKRTEFEFMNEVQGQVERCLVAPNKMDLVPRDEREEFLDYIRETALPKHWKGAITPPVLGISALAALHPEEHEEPGLVSAFEDLRGRLETMAEEERGKLLLARRGNPEKKLFGRAKELEGEDFYGRAHRVYFDLLDVLEAADLDPTPAEEGIARCEEHLSKQVDALDTLNERYNEAMALADEDPDAALERLEAIRDEKKDLRLEDGDLHASIEQLRSRIEERDAARQEIQQIKAQVGQHRHNENWIEAAKVAQEIRPLIDTAELSEERAATLRQFVKAQEQDRDEWAEERWMAIKDEADACVEEQRYLDAAEQLDDLKTVAPYTPFEEETADFVSELTEKAKLETEYREAVQDALEEAAVLRQNRVDPEEGEAFESAIETAEETYRALYGAPDLPTRPSLGGDALPLTIDQKLGLALHLRTLAGPSPNDGTAEALADELRERRREIQSLSLDDRDGLDLVEEYPDHPEAGAALDELLNARPPFWALPSQIRRTQATIEKYQDFLPEEKVEECLEELEERAAHFQWHGEDSVTAIILLLIGMFFGAIGIISGGTIPGLVIGALSIFGAPLPQYFRPNSSKKDRLQEQDSVQKDGSSRSLRGDEGTKRDIDGGRPAGTWRCLNCGNEKRKGKGYTVVMCQCCNSQMQFVGGERNSKEISSTTETDFSGKKDSEKDEKCNHRFERNNNGTNVCIKCGRSKSFLESKAHKRSTGVEHQSESGCAYVFQFILALGGLWLAMQTCSM